MTPWGEEPGPGACLLAGLVTLQEIHAGAASKELKFVGRAYFGVLRVGLCPVGGTPC